MLPNGITPVLVSRQLRRRRRDPRPKAHSASSASASSAKPAGAASSTKPLGEGGSFYWWIALYPGLAIFLTVFAYNLIGEALRDALDPKLKQRD